MAGFALYNFVGVTCSPPAGWLACILRACCVCCKQVVWHERRRVCCEEDDYLLAWRLSDLCSS